MAALPIGLHWGRTDATTALREREWLATNGVGGYAAGTVLGISTRQYHGLFVPNLTQPTGRFMCVPHLDELVHTAHRTVNLAGAEFADQRCSNGAADVLREFRLDMTTPVWVFDIDGTVLEKSIMMPHGQNTTCVRYRVLAGPGLKLCVRLFCTMRRLDAAVQRSESPPFTLNVDGDRIEFHGAGGLALRVATSPPTLFVAQRHVDRDVFYAIERDRGYGHVEHVHSPGHFDFDLSPDKSAALFLSCEPWGAFSVEPDELFAAEAARQAQLIELSRIDDDGVAERLAMATDQFIVAPGSRRDESLLAAARGADARSVMAGYYWFTDWGRDTMIALEGLTLCTRRYREARAILSTFARYVKEGLLPNLFPEGQRHAVYHTADATLWYFHAIDRYLAHTDDLRLIAELYPILQSIVGYHLRGTSFHIGADPVDGLLYAGEEGYALTWMDAKVGDRVITARRGKPVEIQALWYNALQCMAHWAERMGADDSYYRGQAVRVCESFNARFWNEEAGCLFDVIDGPLGDDPTVRPNQIFALSLPRCVLDAAHWRAVLATIERELLTPAGLRSLSPAHPDYCGHYGGAQLQRDGAYHQGTVWPWLLGPYVDAYLRVHGDSNATRTRARQALTPLVPHLNEAGMGSISEIFDGDAPHAPRGTVAQAWSVGEMLRAWLRTDPGDRPDAREASARVVAAAGPRVDGETVEATGEEDPFAGLVNEPVAGLRKD